MNKEFVPYNESLELKALGFDEPCLAFFTWKNELKPIKQLEDVFNSLKNSKVNTTYCSSVAPTFSQAFRWFREKYNLEYQIIKSANGNYSVVIHLNTQKYLNKISTLQHACLDEIVDCYSYEEAELACLNKLIEICRKTKVI